jgi:hypothetical protein
MVNKLTLGKIMKKNMETAEQQYQTRLKEKLDILMTMVQDKILAGASTFEIDATEFPYFFNILCDKEIKQDFKIWLRENDLQYNYSQFFYNQKIIIFPFE